MHPLLRDMNLDFFEPPEFRNILSRLKLPLLSTLILESYEVLGFGSMNSRADLPSLVSLTIEYYASYGEERPIREMEYLLAAMPLLRSLKIINVDSWHLIAAAMNSDPLPVPRLEDVVVEDSSSLGPLVSIFGHRSSMQCPVHRLTLRHCEATTSELKSAFEGFVGRVRWEP